MEINVATSEQEIRSCFPAFHELRPHLAEERFVDQVLRQREAHGYVLVYGRDGGRVVAAAGYRVAEFLAWGRTFYLDDLVTVETARRRGFGGALLDWLVARAGELRCDEFHLDSGVHRHAAHRLYMSRKFEIGSHHFSRALRGSGP